MCVEIDNPLQAKSAQVATLVIIASEIGNIQGRFYVGAGGAQAPQMLASSPPKYFGSNSKNTHC